MKRTALIIFLTLAALAAGPRVAGAADESIAIKLAAKPSAGPLYKEVYRPLNANLTVTVSSPPAEDAILPLKVANVRFPQDMEFFPNPVKTPVCPPDKLNETSNLSAGVVATVALCPRSVIGTGSAVVQLAQQKFGTVTDPKFVIFNAGRNASGRPKLLIYGFSKSVNSGLLMRGTLATNGDLRIEIGVLPFDSSVSSFVLGIPGIPLVITDEGNPEPVTVKGLDPMYLRGKCSTGNWRATGAFELGTRQHPSGIPISPSTFLTSNAFDLPCEGNKGKAKLAITKPAGPGKIKTGGKIRYKVGVRNSGTATAKSVTLKASGSANGKVTVENLAPGASRQVKVMVRVPAGAKSGKLKFQASGPGISTASSTIKVTVR